MQWSLIDAWTGNGAHRAVRLLDGAIASLSMLMLSTTTTMAHQTKLTFHVQDCSYYHHYRNHYH